MAPVPTSVIGFFDEAPGVRSSMRLMAFLCVCAGIACALLTLLRPSSGDTGMYLTGMLLGAGMTGKLVQKSHEPPASPPQA